jgi:hypothetical protein
MKSGLSHALAVLLPEENSEVHIVQEDWWILELGKRGVVSLTTRPFYSMRKSPLYKRTGGFLNSARDEWLVSRPGRFTPGGKAQNTHCTRELVDF